MLKTFLDKLKRVIKELRRFAKKGKKVRRVVVAVSHLISLRVSEKINQTVHMYETIVATEVFFGQSSIMSHTRRISFVYCFV